MGAEHRREEMVAEEEQQQPPPPSDNTQEKSILEETRIEEEDQKSPTTIQQTNIETDKEETPKIEGEQSSSDIGGATTNAGDSKPEKDQIIEEEPSIGVGSTTPNAAGAGIVLNYMNLFRFKTKERAPKIEGEQSSINVGGTTSYAGGWKAEQDQITQEEPLVSTTPNVAAIFGETKPRLPRYHIVDIPIGSVRSAGGCFSWCWKWLEILKCIVQGGLIESITSLSIVFAASASDATTLNVVVIALATLLSGLVAFGCNLVELRNNNLKNKFENVLGRKGNFALHSTFAMLSYLVFGLVAPTTYGFAIYISNNKYLSIIIVAAVAFPCIFVLAIVKAFVNGTFTFGGYAKTVSYHVTIAVSISGVAYGAGVLLRLLLDNLGWFQLEGDVVVPLVSETSPVSGWAS